MIWCLWDELCREGKFWCQHICQNQQPTLGKVNLLSWEAVPAKFARLTLEHAPWEMTTRKILNLISNFYFLSRSLCNKCQPLVWSRILQIWLLLIFSKELNVYIMYYIRIELSYAQMFLQHHDSFRICRPSTAKWSVRCIIKCIDLKWPLHV